MQRAAKRVVGWALREALFAALVVFVAFFVILAIFSALLVPLAAAPLSDTPPGDDFLRSAAFLSIRHRFESEPPPSPPAF
jgi:hypothetical protein